MTKVLKKNLKRQVKLTMYFLMIKEKQIMISSDMLLFRVLEDKGVLKISIFLHLFLIFLKMSLEILVLELLVDQEEDQTIEVVI